MMDSIVDMSQHMMNNISSITGTKSYFLRGQDDWDEQCTKRIGICTIFLVLCPLMSILNMNRKDQVTKKSRNHFQVETKADVFCVLSYFATIGFVVWTLAYRASESYVDSRWNWPSPLGLSMGIGSVFVFQVLLTTFHYARHRWSFLWANDHVIQVEKPSLNFSKELLAHATRWEGLALLLPYLCLTWMFNLMPQSYYDLSHDKACVLFFGLFDPIEVVLQLLCVDFFMYLAHISEHRINWLYRSGHKRHHRWKNPRLFDAYSGHFYDTTLMILVPLYAAANVVHSSCPGYIAFGTTYATYLMLLHAEYALPWDAWSRRLGIGTAYDHNVHHVSTVYNYGHFFMLWDHVFGTYLDAGNVKKIRINKQKLN